MKNSMIKTMFVTAILIFSVAFSFSQNGNCGAGSGGGMCANISDLTQDQKDKIETLKTAQQKSMLTFKNQLDVKNAQLEVLMTADKPDQTAIDKMIEETGALKISMQKKRAEHRLAVRNILTDKQCVEFDAEHGRGQGKGNCGKNGNGNKNGCGNGNGNGQEHRYGKGCGKNM